jgi:transposase
MKPRRVAAVPAKADVQVQKEFLAQSLEPKLAEAQAGRRAVFFVDAAHFVQAPFLGIVWCFARLFIKAPAGRRRFNVLGALNAVTKELVTVCNDTYINAASVCRLLDRLAALCPATPVSLVMDNARYQRCALVQAHAKQLGLELLFLPSYSPNLNLIERLWRHVKKECLYSRYYADFAEFKQALAACLEQTALRDKEKLRTLLALRFQLFESAGSKAA